MTNNLNDQQLKNTETQNAHAIDTKDMNTRAKLTRESLWTLEDYSLRRQDFRTLVMAHKQQRQLVLHDNARLLFEDSVTMRYQVQEMLRIEKIFEAKDIQEELDAYNPLIPDGDNWKATLMIEYEDVEIRKQKLTEIVGIEDQIWIQVDGHSKVFAIADEDMQRSDADKTSSVHFMRFQLTESMVVAAKNGALLSAGCDLPAFFVDSMPIDDQTSHWLRQDLL